MPGENLLVANQENQETIIELMDDNVELMIDTVDAIAEILDDGVVFSAATETDIDNIVEAVQTTAQGKFLDSNMAPVSLLSEQVVIAASQTDSAFVTASPGDVIRVVSFVALTGGTATSVTINSKPAGAGTTISGPWTFGANGGIVLPPSPLGWFESVVSEGISVTTGAGSDTTLHIQYYLV